jgi:membrane protease YdiL (CAAX protease family)
MPRVMPKVAMMTGSVGSGIWKLLRGEPATGGANPPIENSRFYRPDILLKLKVWRGLLFWFFYKNWHLIKKTSAALNPPGNPYRAILRRDYPEPLIALLAFILGIWLWDHYFGKSEGYAPGTEEIALVKIDRDLRLADAMEEDPKWLKWLVGVDEPATTRADAIQVFRKLAAEKSISPQGLEAFAIVRAVHEGLPLQESLGEVLQGGMISEFQETSEQLAAHRGTWWHAELIGSWEQTAPPGTYWRQIYGNDNFQLRSRAVAARSAIWILGLIGLAFVPTALRCLKGGLSKKPKGYGGAWPMSMGLVVFLVATLAWIGFSMALELGFASLPNIHPAVVIFLDSVARVLPTLIALSLLFKRPSHAIRVMGLNQPVRVRVILGMFSLLMVMDQALRWAMGATGGNDPGGGLSLGDSGMWGLVFAVLSACLLAPLAEEILYRGVLFRSLRNRLGVIPGALLSAAVFAVLHFYDGYGLVSVGVFGFFCALLYAGTGSLATVIVLHVLYNASIKIPEWIVYHAPLG